MHRHGDRRWRCIHCQKTCRRLRRKRGRPRVRGFRPRTTEAFLTGTCTVRSLADRTHRSYGTTHRRLQRGLTTLLRVGTVKCIPVNGKFILIADAKWITVCGKRLSIYIILLRPTSRSIATTAVMLPRWEWESERGWRAALLLLPGCVRRRIVGATLDEHHGLRNAVPALCGEGTIPLPIQWCQFHCIAEFQLKIGKKAIKRNVWTAIAWEIARSALHEPHHDRRTIWLCMLQLVLRMRQCPEKTRRGILWFLSRLDSTTVVFARPSLRLPTTTACAESMCNLLRTFLGRVRPRSFARVQRACDLFLRRHQTVRCRPWQDTIRNYGKDTSKTSVIRLSNPTK